MIIYKIVNNIDGKIYVGQTTRSLRVRWYEHCGKKQNCRRLSRAINKYGKDNFSIIEIDTAASIEELNHKETEWIKRLNSTNKKIGYNIEAGGLNKFTSEETREKLQKRRHPSEVYGDWSEKLTGIRKWSNQNYRGPKTKQHALNISKNCHTRRAVNQYDMQGNLLGSFETIKEASEHTNIGRNSISACCTGRTKASKGCTWRYKNH